MKLYGISVAFSAMLLVVAAQSDSNVDAVDKAIRQQSAVFLKGEPHPDGPLKVIIELVTAAAPKSIRQDVAKELAANGDGALSDNLKERINHYILQWSLLYVPEDLQKDFSEALDEYQTTGHVSNDKERNERIRRYLAVLKNGRNKRGFWMTLLTELFWWLIDELTTEPRNRRNNH